MSCDVDSLKNRQPLSQPIFKIICWYRQLILTVVINNKFEICKTLLFCVQTVRLAFLEPAISHRQMPSFYSAITRFGSGRIPEHRTPQVRAEKLVQSESQCTSDRKKKTNKPAALRVLSAKKKTLYFPGTSEINFNRFG